MDQRRFSVFNTTTAQDSTPNPARNFDLAPAQNFEFGMQSCAGEIFQLMDILNRGDYKSLPAFVHQVNMGKQWNLLEAKILCFVEGLVARGKHGLLGKLREMCGPMVVVYRPHEFWETYVDKLSGLDMLTKYNTELEKLTKDAEYKTDYIFVFHVFTMYMRMFTLQSRLRHGNFVYLCEKSIYSDRIFFDSVVKSLPHAISSDNRDIYLQIYSIFTNLMASTSQMCVYMCDLDLDVNNRVNECLERMRIRGREHDGSITFEYLKDLDARYLDMITNHKFDHKIIFSNPVSDHSVVKLYSVILGMREVWRNAGGVFKM